MINKIKSIFKGKDPKNENWHVEFLLNLASVLKPSVYVELGLYKCELFNKMEKFCDKMYGIDMAAAKELIASQKSTDQITQNIGADRLIYQDIDALIRAVSHDNSGIKGFDTSCFTGEYITNDINDEYLKNLEKNRNDDAKKNELNGKSESFV